MFLRMTEAEKQLAAIKPVEVTPIDPSVKSLLDDDIEEIDSIPAHEELLEADGKRFTIKNQKMLLTYPDHVDKVETEAWFRGNFKSYSIGMKFLRIANETGKTGHKHAHVLIDWGKQFQSVKQSVFDMNFGMNSRAFMHPNIRMIKNKTHWESCARYLAKEDPENKDLLELFPIKKGINFDGIFGSKSTIEAIRNHATKLSDVIPIITMKGLYTPPVDPRRAPWEPTQEWQRWVADMDNLVPDNRKVTWIWDKKGNCGKTQLGLYMQRNFGNRWYYSKCLGNDSNASTTIAGAIKCGWSQWGWIIDLPRKAVSYEGFYSTLESLKDGAVTTQKYEGRTEIFEPPHVVVFANWPPKVWIPGSGKTMSLDRWQIRQVDRESGKLKVTEVKDLFKEQKAAANRSFEGFEIR